MVDFRTSGVTSSRSSYGSPGRRSGYSSGGSVYRIKRDEERAAAFARPGLGQWQPGALSRAPVGTYGGGRPQYSGGPQPSSRYPLVQRGGKTGYLVPAPTVLGESEAFALKKKWAEGQKQPDLPGSPGVDFGIPGIQPNTTNPFMPNFTGQAADPFAGMMEGGASMMQPTPEGTPEGARRGGILGAIDAYFNWGEEIEEAMGMTTRDAQGNITSWETPAIAGLGVGGTASTLPKSLSSMLSKATAGKITKDTFYRGSMAKSAQTFSKWLRQSLTQKNLIKTFHPKSMSLKTAGVLAGTVVTAAWVGYGLVKGGREEQVMGTWGMKEELPQMCSMMYNKLMREDNPEGAKKIINICREEGKKAIEFSMIPGKTGIKENERYFDAWDRIMDVVEEHDDVARELRAEGLEPGMEDQGAYWEAYHQRVEERQTREEEQRVIFYNNQRIATEQKILELRAAAREETAAANKKILEEQAAFWEAYKKKILALEGKERERSAKFWLDYRRAVAEIEEQQRLGRSRLKFGLL